MNVEDLKSMKAIAEKCADMTFDVDRQQSAWHKGYASAISEILSEIEDGFLTLVTHD